MAPQVPMEEGNGPGRLGGEQGAVTRVPAGSCHPCPCREEARPGHGASILGMSQAAPQGPAAACPRPGEPHPALRWPVPQHPSSGLPWPSP